MFVCTLLLLPLLLIKCNLSVFPLPQKKPTYSLGRLCRWSGSGNSKVLEALPGNPETVDCLVRPHVTVQDSGSLLLCVFIGFALQPIGSEKQKSQHFMMSKC